MKKVIVIIVLLLSLFTSIFASKATFSVAETITKYSINNESFEVENNIITLDLNDNELITIISDDNKETLSKVVFTEHNKIAATFSWDISNTKLRYTLNNSKPKTIKKDINKLTLKNLPSNELSIFTLEAKVKNNWIECGRVGLIPVNIIEAEELQEEVISENSVIDSLEAKLISNKEKKISIRLTLSPYSIGIYDFFNGHNIPDARYLTITNYGLSADGEVGYQVNNNILLYLGAGYGYQMKKETIIPNAFRVSYLKALVGLDLRFIKVGKFSSSLGVFAGGMMGINAGVYNISSILGGRIRFDYYLNSHLSLGLQTRFTASYLSANDPLYKSMTYLIDPLTLSLNVRF